MLARVAEEFVDDCLVDGEARRGLSRGAAVLAHQGSRVEADAVGHCVCLGGGSQSLCGLSGAGKEKGGAAVCGRKRERDGEDRARLMTAYLVPSLGPSLAISLGWYASRVVCPLPLWVRGGWLELPEV